MDYSKSLLLKVAELYYNQNMNQQQIGDKLKISRVKVSRLLTEAKNKGIVKIDIIYPKDNCLELERELEERYNLEEAVIISARDKSKDVVYSEVTSAVAQFLEEKVNKNDIIGIAWGRTLKKVANRIREVNKEVRIVQLLGNIGSSDVSGDIIVRTIANSFHGSIHLLPTPAIVDNVEIKQAIMSDGNVSNIFAIQKQCSLAIVGVGVVSEKSTLALSDYLNQNDLSLLKQDGAVGEVCGRFIDKHGNVCETPVNDRVLGIDIKDLAEIPCVVAVATGDEKVKPIQAVLNTGAINVLVTDENTARRLL
ncbi:hypothetical protein GC105_06320 [Alkalibaculum sp. M08DMB]|uniref:Sugar-binding domain-containing protein n=1 Tax=Alkalibaculum sporogenes TaxID=2655001 RepID=A0A6A7K7D6_9FIRM|nr:sugar-binding transcriptional regulator [Alkalibaculum sporogenes]MPW25399.1 hypothetical protein [Alkalibaculum sporogenes]